MERRLIGQRTRDAMQAKKAAGQRGFGRPSLVSAEVADRIEAEREQGLTLKEIAEGLNDDAVATVYGGRWWPSSVQSVLQSRENDRLAGLLEVSAGTGS